MGKINLRKLLTARLGPEEISILWFELFGTSMYDDIPNRGTSDCVIELLVRVKRRQLRDTLVSKIAELFPWVLEDKAGNADGSMLPSGASRLLEQLLNESDSERILGDLHEEYDLRIRTEGQDMALQWLTWQVLRELAPALQKRLARVAPQHYSRA